MVVRVVILISLLLSGLLAPPTVGAPVPAGVAASSATSALGPVASGVAGVRPRASLSAFSAVTPSGRIRIAVTSNAKKVKLTWRTTTNAKRSARITIRRGMGSKTLARGSTRVFAQALATKKLRASTRVPVLPYSPPALTPPPANSPPAVAPPTTAAPTTASPTADTTPPGPVTGLVVSGSTRSSLSLVWVLPTDADLTMVVVRRAQGRTPPAGADSGQGVSVISPSAASVTDTGLAPSTDYAYAVFAQDAAGNTSPAATIVGRTLPKLSPLSAGGFHTCGLDSEGHAWCWGLDVFGEVGDGLGDQDKLAPVAVIGGLTFTSLTAGWIHTCGLDTNGLTWCWGKDGAYNQHTPVNVVGAFSFLAAGAEFTCALDPAGHAWCWGYDTYGQVGDGPDDQFFKYIPVAVASDSSFASLTAGSNHACGVDATGQAWCWGWDMLGQVGDGPADQENKYAPIQVTGDLSFTSLAAGGRHTCGLDGTGKAWCWGDDAYGQVGDGAADQENKYAPIQVASDLSFTSLAAGNSHTCGLDGTGKAWCWGDDAYGQVGDGPADQTQKPSPVAVAGGLVFSSLTAGDRHTCGMDATEQAWCWGSDEDGQLGDGTAGQGNQYAPVAVAGGISFTIP